jgi:hypothetical protein
MMNFLSRLRWRIVKMFGGLTTFDLRLQFEEGYSQGSADAADGELLIYTFMDGAEWREQNPSADVRALVKEAIENAERYKDKS